MTNNWKHTINWKKMEEKIPLYMDIMSQYNSNEFQFDWNSDSSRMFRRKFNYFYKVRRDENFQKVYYDQLYTLKGKLDITFKEVIEFLYSKTNRVEASFTSKLIATVNPQLPVWDSVVLSNREFKAPYPGAYDRINKIIELYDKIKEWYAQELYSEQGREMLSYFDSRFNHPEITDLKKRDLMEWQQNR